MDDGPDGSVSALEPSISHKEHRKSSKQRQTSFHTKTKTKSGRKRSKLSQGSQPEPRKSSHYGRDLDHVEDVPQEQSASWSKGSGKGLQNRQLTIGVLGFLLLVGLYILIAYFAEIFPFAGEACNTAVCPEDLEELRFHIRDLFRESTHFHTNQPGFEGNPGLPDQEPLIATTVRLIFHDCGGPPTQPIHDEHYANRTGYNLHATALCDGCIQLNSNNHGFLEEGAVEPLEELYLSLGLQHKMSRSDC